MSKGLSNRILTEFTEFATAELTKLCNILKDGGKYSETIQTKILKNFKNLHFDNL